MSRSNPDPQDWFTRTRWIMYGTASTFLEMVQDPEKREENWSKLSMDVETLADELAAKGEQTELDALRYLDQMAQQQEQAHEQPHAPRESTEPHDPPPSGSTAGSPGTTQTTGSTQTTRSTQSPPSDPSIQSDPSTQSTAADPASASPSQPPSSTQPAQSATVASPFYRSTPSISQAPTSITPDEIADLMKLTRDLETLRLDLERKRTDSSQ